ncbi:gag-pol fusion protein-like protein, partial [Leptotrombidium deliense]
TPQLIPVTSPFGTIHLDIAGPLNVDTRSGKKFFVVAIDRLTKYVEIKALKETTASEVVKFLNKRVFLRHGYPELIITDNGVQFVAKEFEKCLRDNNIRHNFASIYHPEANGAAERVIRTIKQMLTAMRGKWDEKLPYVNFAYNTAVHEATGHSPFETVYGRNALVPSDLRLGRKDYSVVCASADPIATIT